MIFSRFSFLVRQMKTLFYGSSHKVAFLSLHPERHNPKRVEEKRNSPAKRDRPVGRLAETQAPISGKNQTAYGDQRRRKLALPICKRLFSDHCANDARNPEIIDYQTRKSRSDRHALESPTGLYKNDAQKDVENAVQKRS